MKLKLKVIFYLVIIPLVLFCTKNNKTPTHKKGNSYEYFEVLEETLVEIPIEYSFKYLLDLSFNDIFLYLCTSNSKYPILKVDLTTNTVAPIGRMGNGPNEFTIPPRRISAFKNWLMVTDGPHGGYVYLFKDTKLLQKKFFEPFPIALRIYDVAVIENGKFLISGAGDSRYYFLLLDSTLTPLQSQPYPPHSTITSAVLGIMWTAQVLPGSDILLHPIYPDVAHILRKNGNFTIEEIPLHLSNFPHADRTLTRNDFYKSIKDPLKLYRKIGKLIWIVMNQGTLQGAYLYGKLSQGRLKNTAVLFVRNNNSSTELEIKTRDLTHFIPDKNKLYFYEPVMKANTLILKIQHVKLKLE